MTDKQTTGWESHVGKSLFIRTVTYHLVGKVEDVTDGVMALSEASFIGDSGRFSQAIKNGTLAEVEPVGAAFVNVAAITDAFPWVHPLPATQK